MRPRDWFSVGVRLIGVYVFYQGFGYVNAYVANHVELLSRSQVSRDFDGAQPRDWYFLMLAAGHMAFGFLLFYGGERITRLTFSEPPRPADEVIEREGSESSAAS